MMNVTIVLVNRADSTSSNNSTRSSSNHEQIDDKQNEVLSSYAARIEHLQEYEKDLFNN